jgi:hypothetical protein
MGKTKEKKEPSAAQLAHWAKMSERRKGVSPAMAAQPEPSIPLMQAFTPVQQAQSSTTKYMEATVAEIEAYRPKKGQLEINEDKLYEFELNIPEEIRKSNMPVDKATGLPIGTGYRASTSFPNWGIAWNQKAKMGKGDWEKWRYIQGQPSCWVSEQPELADYEKKDIDTLLGDATGGSDLEFKDGKLLVRGDANGQLTIQALMLSDYNIDNPKPRKKRPAIECFKLNNPDVLVEQGNDINDLAYATETQARNCTITEMLAVASLIGINIDDTTPAGLNRIKYAFLGKAKYDPRNPKGKEALEQFMSIINNPTTKMKYLINQALLRGILSTTQLPGKLTWASMEAPILELGGKQSTADELSARAIDKEKPVLELLAELETQIKN